MSFIQRNLGLNEQVIQEAKVSMIALVPTVLVAVAIFFMVAAIGDGTITTIGLLIAALLVAGKYFEMREIELVVTNKKVAGKFGWIRKTHMDLPLDKVNTVTVSNTFFGAIFGYGTITITASSGQFTYKQIVAAESFKGALINAIDKYKDEQMTQQARRMAEAMQGASYR